MSYLIFCSFEVGGLPYKMAEILNKHGVETYYISLAQGASDHNSTQFHYGKRSKNWDLSPIFSNGVLSFKEIIKHLSLFKRKYDSSYCFATGDKAYLLKQAGIDYKYWCYGSDLDQNCFAPIWPPNYPSWKKYIRYLYFISTTRYRTRESISGADSVMIAPYQIEALDLVCRDKRLFFLPHFLEILDYEKLTEQKEESKNKICKEIQAKHFFFSSARHFWKESHGNMADNKGNDVVLKSFAKYIEISNDHDTKLVLVNKGPDVDASKTLAQKLCIEDYTVWVNEMRRDELNKYYQGATICFGQFGTPVITFVALEPLSSATICISFFEKRSTRVPFYKETPPIINSKDPNEIANSICRLINHGDYYTDLKYKSWCWVKDNCSEEIFVKSFLKLFDVDP